jgi:ubiquinone/menaquinone biosynthesis C-methylase UbiE
VKLNLGSGGRPLDGWVNVDVRQLPGVDVLADLDQPWPWDDAAIEAIMAAHVFEHVSDPVLFMTEAHRVLAPGGQLTVLVPHYLSPDAFTDPTHKRYCTEHTMDYWIPGTPYHANSNYGGVSFILVKHLMIGDRQTILWKLRKPTEGNT